MLKRKIFDCNNSSFSIHSLKIIDVATDQFISTAVISGNPKDDEPQDTDPALMSTFVVGRGSSMPDLTVVGSSTDLAKTCDDISGKICNRICNFWSAFQTMH